MGAGHQGLGSQDRLGMRLPPEPSCTPPQGVAVPDPSYIDQELVRRALSVACLSLPDDQLDDVVANLRRMALLAQLLACEPLDPHEEPGPRWVP